MSGSVEINMAVGTPAVGANVTLFCGVMKLLDRRYPKRGVDQAGMNRMIELVGQLDCEYAALPQVGKGAGK